MYRKYLSFKTLYYFYGHTFYFGLNFRMYSLQHTNAVLIITKCFLTYIDTDGRYGSMVHQIKVALRTMERAVLGDFYYG